MWHRAGHLQGQAEYSRFTSAHGRATSVVAAWLLALVMGGGILAPWSGTALAVEDGDSILQSDEPVISEDAETEAPALEPVEEPVDEPPAPRAAATADADVQVRDDAPLRYVVKKGDTLWDISGYYLKQPWKWPELWYSNPDIKNPHLIYPGDVLYLTYVDGKPRLSREPPDSEPSSVEKMSPHIREQILEEAIPTIPGEVIRAFLNGPRVVGANELDAAPYILQFIGEHLIGGAGIPAYAKGLKADAASDHIVVRKGEPYRDPESKEILGYEATHIGTASVNTPGEPARINIDTSVREVLIGDRLLPQSESDLLDSAYFPRYPEAQLQGYIIAVTGGVSQIVQYQIITLNKGKRDGLEVGHVFSIYQAGRQARDPYSTSGKSVTLPEEKAGTFMVFKTYERISYALVMKSTRSIHVLDKFRTPEP